jgi:hypothetical protein
LYRNPLGSVTTPASFDFSSKYLVPASSVAPTRKRKTVERMVRIEMMDVFMLFGVWGGFASVSMTVEIEIFYLK